MIRPSSIANVTCLYRRLGQSTMEDERQEPVEKAIRVHNMAASDLDDRTRTCVYRRDESPHTRLLYELTRSTSEDEICQGIVQLTVTPPPLSETQLSLKTNPPPLHTAQSTSKEHWTTTALTPGRKWIPEERSVPPETSVAGSVDDHCVEVTLHSLDELDEWIAKTAIESTLGPDVAVTLCKIKKSTFLSNAADIILRLNEENWSEKETHWLERTWCKSICQNLENKKCWMGRRGLMLDEKALQCPKHKYKLKAMSLGSFRSAQTFVSHWTNVTQGLEKANVTFEHDTKTFRVKLIERNNIVHIVETTFDNLDKFLLVTFDTNTNQTGGVTLYLFLRKPVKLFKGRKLPGVRKNNYLVQLYSQEESVKRYVDMRREIRFWDCPEDVIGSSNVLRVDLLVEDSLDFDRLIFKLGRQKITALFSNPTVVSCACEDHASSFDLVRPHAKMVSQQFSSFEVSYAWFCLASHGYKVTDQFTPNFIDLVRSKKDDNLLNEVLYSVANEMNKRSIGILMEIFEQEFNHVTSIAHEINAQKLPLTVVRHILLTPTTKRGQRAEQTGDNRVIREFNPDRFLTVSVREENDQLLTSSSGCSERIIEVITRFLTNGLRIADRHYRYLGSSNSQLREHSVWLYASDGLNTVESIRAWMGDLSTERCVATYVARLGQCFSTTTETVEVKTWTIIPDIKYNGRNFTDGIGKLSVSLAKKISTKLQLKFTPSAFQIRFGGCKGVVAVDPTLGSEDILQVRESMIKFQSPHNKLEVLAYTKPARLHLNRQVIVILSGQGISGSVFFALQDAMLQQLNNTLLNEDIALKAISVVKTNIDVGALKTAEIGFTVEPFFRSLSKQLYQLKFRELLRRTRIEIPPDKGRYMMGTVDETNSLNYGEVFVQYSNNLNKPKSTKLVLEGLVLVAKNPCLHPGDVRKFCAVNQSKLSHMIDCIVFPAKGQRPHPDEMSGSDLDGDMYFVCWVKTLIPAEENIPPMDYTPKPKQELSRRITEADMITFIGKYIKNIQLGTIDNAHLVHADASGGGIFSQQCIDLAMMHWDAVDFPKTGHSPVMTPELQPKRYPHFMIKNDKAVYTSEHVIARLYDQCNAIDKALQHIESNSVELDADFKVAGYENYLSKAMAMNDSYSLQMQAIMNRYELESEIEAWTGQKLLRYSRRYGGTEFADKVKIPMSDLRHQMNSVFYKEFGETAEHHSAFHAEIRMKISAIYYVTYNSRKNVHDDQHPKMFGLPWLFPDILSSIKFDILKARKSFGDYPIASGSQSLLHKLSTGIRSISDTTCQQNVLLSARNDTFKELDAIIMKDRLDVRLVLFGSTLTTIINDSSSVDILIVSKTSENVPIEVFKTVIDAIFKVATSDRNIAPTLSLEQKKIVLNFSQRDLKVIVVADSTYLRRSAYIISAMCKNKWIIPCLRVIAAWANNDKAKIFGSGSSCLLSYEELLLMFLYIAFRVSTSCIEPSELETEFVSDLLMQNHFQQCPIALCHHFDTYVTVNVPNAVMVEESGRVFVENKETRAAELVLLFFRHFGSNRDNSSELYANISDLSFANKHVGLMRLNREQSILLSDRMTQAYHTLAHSASIEDFLSNKIIQGEHLEMKLPYQVSSFIAFSKHYHEKKLKSDSGADSVTIRLKIYRNETTSLILEAWGNSCALSIISQSVQDLIKSATMLTRNSEKSSRVFGQDAYHVAFEGSGSEKDTIRMRPYTGRCQQASDRFVKHVPELLSVPYPNENHVLDKFSVAFRQQIHLIKQNYNEISFDELRVIISFGTYYVTSAKTEDISVESLESLLSFKKTSLPYHADTRADWRRDTRNKDAHRYGRDNDRRRPTNPGRYNNYSEHSSGRDTRESFHPESRNYYSEFRNKQTWVRSNFIPSRIANLRNLRAFLESRNYKLTQQLEEYRPTVKLKTANEKYDNRSHDGVLVLDNEFNFKWLQWSDIKWFVFDTVRSRNYISNSGPDDIRFKICSRSKTSNMDILCENNCEDLLLNANKILVRHGEYIIGVHEDYKTRVFFLRHKHLEEYECQDKTNDLASQCDIFLRQVKIKVNRGHEYTHQKSGDFRSADRDRVEVTCMLRLPDIHELDQSEQLCEQFIRWIWQFGREFGSILE